jgi:hypothetical protein
VGAYVLRTAEACVLTIIGGKRNAAKGLDNCPHNLLAAGCTLWTALGLLPLLPGGLLARFRSYRLVCLAFANDRLG